MGQTGVLDKSGEDLKKKAELTIRLLESVFRPVALSLEMLEVFTRESMKDKSPDRRIYRQRLGSPQFGFCQ